MTPPNDPLVDSVVYETVDYLFRNSVHGWEFKPSIFPPHQKGETIMGTQKVRAKMTVSEIREYRGYVRNPETGAHETVPLHGVKMAAVAGGNPEDNSYSNATPSATVDISVTNPETVGFFKIGASYYVDFTPSE